MDYKRTTIRSAGEEIQTHIYILTFYKPTLSKEVKIRYFIERVEQYIPTLFISFSLFNSTSVFVGYLMPKPSL